jgi:PIN domain nuclease of toxin-antitoxin system
MTYLADTHVLLWSFLAPENLSSNVRTILFDEENTIFYSPVSLWEITIKYSIKKLNLNGGTPEDFYQELYNSYYIRKEIDDMDIVTLDHLPIQHKDPFDRFLIWEAIRNNFSLLTVDDTISQYTQYGLKIES